LFFQKNGPGRKILSQIFLVNQKLIQMYIGGQALKLEAQGIEAQVREQ
jgi:hypothetical protein